MADAIDLGRSVLQSANLHSLIDYLSSLKGSTTAERAMKARKKFSDTDQTVMRLALETCATREEMTGVLPWAEEGFFIKSRVEQATRPEIACHHALAFKGKKVIEIGCGIGFDTAALAREASEVVAIDTDALSAAVAEHNLALQGITNVTVRATSFEEFLARDDWGSFEAIWSDPARRSEDGERIYAPDDYRPPLAQILALSMPKLAGIKISPALNIQTDGAWQHEFVGWEWGCPEQVLWRGLDKAKRSAHLADAKQSWHPKSSAEIAGMVPLKCGSFLIEPHPALVRTHALEHFFYEHGMSLLDPQLAYGLIEKKPAQSPWFRDFQIVEFFKFNQKSLKERLMALGWDRRTQIKKRGLDDDPDDLHRSLRLPPADKDSPWGYVILCRIDQIPTAILALRPIVEAS